MSARERHESADEAQPSPIEQNMKVSGARHSCNMPLLCLPTGPFLTGSILFPDGSIDLYVQSNEISDIVLGRR